MTRFMLGKGLCLFIEMNIQNSSDMCKKLTYSY